MDVWRILIYAIAAFLAIRSLVALMTVHRHNFRQEVLAEEKRIARELRKKKAREEAQANEAIQQALAAAGSKQAQKN